MARIKELEEENAELERFKEGSDKVPRAELEQSKDLVKELSEQLTGAMSGGPEMEDLQNECDQVKCKLHDLE